jgi:hypothetical protein
VTAGGGGGNPAARHRLEAGGEAAPGFAGVAGGADVGDASAAAVMAARRLRLRGFRHLTR